MEKLLAVTDIFAFGRALLLGAKFSGEAESNIYFEQVFEPVRDPNGGRRVVSGLIALLRIHDYRLGGATDRGELGN